MEDLNLQDILRAIETDLSDPSIIQDNKLIFQYNGKSYRVRMPNQLEESIAQNEKNSSFGKLLMTEGYYLKNKLKQLLKEKQGVDIDELENEKNKINSKIQDFQLSLAQKYDEDVNAIQILKDKINDLSQQRIEIAIKISQYLSCAIEDNIEKIYIQSLSAQCSEVFEEEKWVKVWPSVKAYQEDSSLLATKVLAYMSYLLMNVRAI